MITINFKALLAIIMQAGGSQGLISVKDVAGTAALLAPYFSASDVFPYSTNDTVQIGSGTTSGGIFIGTGNTAPSENDYALENRITSGLTASTTTLSIGVDANGNPYKQLLFTLTNTTNADIVVKEIGYVQQMRSGMIANPSVVTNRRYLLDRTVLSSPITIPANNGTAAIKYILKAVIS